MSWYEHREHLPWFLKNLGLTLPYVECGVMYAPHLEQVRSIWGGRCIGIDSYRRFSPNEYPDASNLQQAEFDRLYSDVSSRYEILRMDTIKAAEEFADGSLGCVYLDSNHTYIHLMQEMEAWWPKIAQGGVMAGHDFRAGLSDDKKTWFAVCRCVHDFAKAHDLAVLRTSDGQDWYCLKIPYYDPSEILVVSNFYGQWPESVKDNHQRYCQSLGYSYAPYDVRPPNGCDPQWSKIPAIQQAWDQNPDKKFIWWVDADVVFMTRQPMHHWSFKAFDLVGGAYKIPGFGEGLLNTSWFGVPRVQYMRDVIDRAHSYGEYHRRYPHEEGAIAKIISPRANDRVLLEDIHHVNPSTFWGHYSSHSWMMHVTAQHGAIRGAILNDICAMSRV